MSLLLAFTLFTAISFLTAVAAAAFRPAMAEVRVLSEDGEQYVRRTQRRSI